MLMPTSEAIARNAWAAAMGCLAALLLFAGSPARAGDDSSEPIQQPPGRPVQVAVSIELVEISQIDDRDQKFEAEFYVYYTWKDARYAFDPGPNGPRRKLINADDTWNPDPELLGELEVDVRGGKVVHAYPDGTLCFSRYYRGTIGGGLDLHEFPLDRHVLEVDLEESVFEADQVQFVPAGVRAMNSERAAPHGWILKGLASEATVSNYSKTGEHYSLIRLKLDVERDPHYYFWAIVLPLIPIVATAWTVFWMHPKEFSSQVSVGITAMLTVVAYRISIDSSLPPLNYMTRMDYFLLACQVFVFGSFLVVVAIQMLFVVDVPEARAAAVRLNRSSRWLPPLLLVACSALLTLLPARCGTWVLIGSGLAMVACHPPTPGQLRMWWQIWTRSDRLMLAEENVAQQSGPIEPHRRNAA